MMFWKKNFKIMSARFTFFSFESDWICPAAAQEYRWENQTAWTEEQGVGTELVLRSNLKQPVPIHFTHDGAFLLHQ